MFHAELRSNHRDTPKMTAVRDPAARMAGGTPGSEDRRQSYLRRETPVIDCPRSLTFPLEFMKNSRKEERLESSPWQTEESISERGKGKPMQPETECPASQGDDGDFLALDPAGALEQEGQLFLLDAFANQARHPTVPPCPSFPRRLRIQHSAAFSGF
jgi:hypothetical protein